MNFPVSLPDWLPWWIPLLLLLPALLYGLAFLFMPFSVIGVKSRLDSMDARLDEMQHEIRQLALRLPAGAREMDFEEIYAPQPMGRRPVEPAVTRPPIPPKLDDLERLDPNEDRTPPPPTTRPIRRPEIPSRPVRSEPRFDRPRS